MQVFASNTQVVGKRGVKMRKNEQKCALFGPLFGTPPAHLVLCGQFVSRISYLVRGLLQAGTFYTNSI